MAHKFSLIVLGSSGSKIKRIHISAKQMVCVATAVVTCLGLSIYGAIQYMTFQSQVSGKKQLEIQLSKQNYEVELQREQIQKFAADINTLKGRLVELGKFQERIRVLANIDQNGSDDGLFGVGGSTPDDLNPSFELQESPRQLIKEMHQQVNKLGDASQTQYHVFASMVDRLEEQKNMLAHTPAIKPAQGWLTSAFSYRQSPFTGKREFHKGIDIANHHGTSVLATADGIISFSGESGSFGQVIVIDHGYGIMTRYAHLQETIKTKGERVYRGDVIALMGNSGHSTGPHLHYEIRINGLPVNPEKYILN